MNDEQGRIKRAKYLWGVVRNKKRIILMMSKLGEGAILELDQLKFKDMKNQEMEDQMSQGVSRFIIMPDNYWKMMWEHMMQLIFIVWIFIFPVLAS